MHMLSALQIRWYDQFPSGDPADTRPLRGANLWPGSAVPELQATVTAHMSHCRALGNLILAALAYGDSSTRPCLCPPPPKKYLFLLGREADFVHPSKKDTFGMSAAVCGGLSEH